MVDNNSTDGTAEIVSRSPRIRLIREPKQGSYVARNRGILAADGEVIAFTDPDCQPHPNWLSCIMSTMRQPGLGIILGKREFASNSSSLSMLVDYETVKAAHVFSSDLKDIYFGYTNNMAVRKSLFDKLGRFLEIERGADTVFVHKAVEEYGCKIVSFTPEVCVRHLEINSVWDFYKKKLIYGQSNERNRSLGTARSLSNSERLGVFIKTVRKQQYSISKSIQFLVLLGLGLLSYEFGRWRAA
jgi:glycosyltransferase involved in cell wall biosynthesis